MAEKDRLVVLTEKELFEIVEKACYSAANSACSKLYDGLAKRFMYQNEEDLERILYEIEQMNRK